ncbi:hypothetical protein D0Z07_3639 [Hyphodiscus hymeniophilus]|uniref:TLC domain-containing protein n=1 Tax=Hyphodiscus hymeniophilus TaxID=353542 RepID=A0A9P6VKU9_9HELO|nr:hypothetical protein D0Z07_3639 [Hyphodiscus hymeniophilus]
MSSIQTLESLRALILLHSDDRLLLLTEILLLFSTTELTSILLYILSPRFRTAPKRRQRQLSIIPPIIAVKLLSTYLIVSTTIHFFQDRFSADGKQLTISQQLPAILRDASIMDLGDELFSYWFLITIGYIFELLYRPSPPLLQGHHMGLQIFNYYYPFYLYQQRQYGLCTGFLVIIIVFGLGIQDSVVDVFVLFHRILPTDNRGTRMVVRGLGILQEFTRLLEWSLMGWYLFTQRGEVSRLLGVWEMVFWAFLLAGWVWTEVDDWFKLRSMWKKFGGKVDEKRE